MEKKILKDWIERFFAAELTMDEERELYRYLCENEVPTELRKDKEAIIALCGEPEEVELPEGAAQRLEEMLDGLEEMKTHHKECCSAALLVGDKSPVVATDAHSRRPCKGGLEAPPRRRTLPHREGWGGSFLLRAACVTGVAMALFLALPEDKDKPLLTEVYEEENTFDNPEEAMQCFMAAYGDIMFAMNTARDNTREAHQAVTQSVKTSLNMLKLEATKNREL